MVNFCGVDIRELLSDLCDFDCGFIFFLSGFDSLQIQALLVSEWLAVVVLILSLTLLFPLQLVT